MSNLEIYNERFDDSGRRVFERALDGARQRGQNYVVVEHFIEALVAEEARFFQLLEGLLKIGPGQVQTLMARRLESFPQKAVGGTRLAPSTIALLKQAWGVARKHQRPKIQSFDLIIALANDERGLLIELLRGLNADLDPGAETIRVLYHLLNADLDSGAETVRILHHFTRVLSLKPGQQEQDEERTPQISRRRGGTIYIPPKARRTKT